MKYTKLFDIFIPVVKKGIKEIQISAGRLTLRVMLEDFLSVAASVGFVIIPSFIVGLLFLLLHQGRDTILLVTEKMAEGQYFPLVFLLAAIFFWSISSELSVRYSIYISDNSGKNLSDERVFFRKTSQKLLAGLLLLWPYVVVLLSLLWNGLYLSRTPGRFSMTNIVLCGVLVYVLMVVKTHLYFKKYGKASPGRSLKTLWGARSLPRQEYNYVQKLYGIYNDYVYSLPKVSNFRNKVKADYQVFADNFLRDSETREGFPQDPESINPLRLVPNEFVLSDSKKIISQKGELYKWTYYIPTNFYRRLHRKIIRLALVSILIVLSVALTPVEWDIFGYIGAPALICTAFACYSGIYTGLLFADKAWLRHWKVSVRVVVLILFFATTLFNQDHPVRELSAEGPQRKDLGTGFSDWLKRYNGRYISSGKNLAPQDKLPVIFICAEGGALRTGAYTGIYLTTLEDTLAEQGIDFRNSVFAMSGVSGGAVGLGYYNAVAYRSHNNSTDDEVTRAKQFFSHDCLSPLVAKMLYGDFLHLFMPFYVAGFDRAVALEESWEVAYGKTIGPGAENVFAGAFTGEEAALGSPLLVLNSTEVETGYQCWVSNHSLTKLRFGDQRDLLEDKVKQIRYSTALNFSSRFPLFSPAAKVGGKDTIPRRHYIDGGYVENTGSASMLEVMKRLKKNNPDEFDRIQPIVIYLLFSDSEAEEPDSITAFNEVTEVIAGIYNTRAGRTKTAYSELREFVSANGGINIHQPLNSKDVPMNWVLSQLAMQNVTDDIDAKLADTTANGILKKLPLDNFPRNRPK